MTAGHQRMLTSILKKGSHFSLLGGTIKKELEKSNQALGAAKLDLTKKIEENEDLHAELSEIKHIYRAPKNCYNVRSFFEARYTYNLNELYKQISELEKQKKGELSSKIQALEDQLVSKFEGVLESERDELLGKHMLLQGEIHMLRAIFFVKVGPLEVKNETASVPALSDELVTNFKIVKDSWSDKMKSLVTELEAYQLDHGECSPLYHSSSGSSSTTTDSPSHNSATADAHHHTTATSASNAQTTVACALAKT
ncbi:hypothetical protein DM01DRAFT_325024 [Hesseltinella vesiculosa]|uniref:Uncharacterized protein n=1 Tax=Hesseltinella vesiculosa TaxID=101127 RepID=A0A1X2G8T8_9FUNG|nr:hypothetical protein DM01DRAFT_325024 [Hesseltinella vesiculosa]